MGGAQEQVLRAAGAGTLLPGDLPETDWKSLARRPLLTKWKTPMDWVGLIRIYTRDQLTWNVKHCLTIVQSYVRSDRSATASHQIKIPSGWLTRQFDP